MTQLPNFTVIGAARSGTTSLFQYLDLHPQISMSPIKELNFFSRDDYEQKGVAWYRRQFHSKDGVLAIGEASTSYSTYPYAPDVAARIASYNPDMRLIYVVRNPIERYVSHFLQRTKAGHEIREFSETLSNLENETSAWQGRYYYQLSQYLRFFPKNQILVISFDQLKFNTEAVVQELYDFLGVQIINLEGSSAEIHNAAGTIYRKNSFGLALLRFYHSYVEQKNIPFRLKKLFTDMANWGGTPVEKPRPTPEQKRLLADFYREDCRKLSETFAVQTSHWFE